MSTKDYILIAATIKAVTNDLGPHQGIGHADYVEGRSAGIEEVARELADLFKAENPRFDIPKFLEAAGV